MRSFRPALAVVLAACVGVSGAAGAASKPTLKPKAKPAAPVCNLITDPAGDASVQPPVPSDDTLDILSADIASNTTTLTAVLRLKNLSATSPFGVTGSSYQFVFSTRHAANPIFLSYAVDATGAASEFGDIEDVQGQSNSTPKGAATTVVDKAKNEVRISVKLADLATLDTIKPGDKLTDLHAATDVVVGTPEATPDVPPGSQSGALVGPGNGLLQGVDDASTTKSYLAGTPSCVTPGA